MDYPSHEAQTRRELSEPTEGTFKSASILVWTNDIIRKLAKKLNGCSDYFEVATEIGTKAYPVSANTTRIDKVLYEGVELARVDFPDLTSSTQEVYPLALTTPREDSSGTPTAYYVRQPDPSAPKEINLTPVPNEVGTLRVYRRFWPTAIASVASTEDLPWDGEYDDLIRAYCVAQGYKQLEKWTSYAAIMGEVNAMLAEEEDIEDEREVSDLYEYPVEVE